MARIGLYQPFIEDRNVRRLYRLKVTYHVRTGRKLPMTALVNRILDDFFEGVCESLLDSQVQERTTSECRSLEDRSL